MSRKPPITDEEIAEFQAAMRQLSSVPSPEPTVPDDDDLPFEEIITTDFQSHDILSYRSPLVTAPQWRQLKQGNIQWLSSLDLHGCTLTEAARRVKPHLRDCSQHNDNYTLIIHGKGLQSHKCPLLKNAMASWLPHDPRVLAFHSAQPKHGGVGALYVMLNTTG